MFSVNRHDCHQQPAQCSSATGTRKTECPTAFDSDSDS